MIAGVKLELLCVIAVAVTRLSYGYLYVYRRPPSQRTSAHTAALPSAAITGDYHCGDRVRVKDFELIVNKAGRKRRQAEPPQRNQLAEA